MRVHPPLIIKGHESGDGWLEAESWEVELKFHVDNPPILQLRLTELAFDQVGVESHEDTYFRHPCRDFKASDEAFRIRRINDRTCLTYKGPRQPQKVKIREEIELEIDSSAYHQWQTMLDRLGFQPVAAVRKTRRIFRCDKSDYSRICVVIDSVEGLGIFAEVEIVVNEPQSLQSAESQVMVLSEQLGLKRVEPRSYLDQLLEKNQSLNRA